jgi:hypothetical protein
VGYVLGLVGIFYMGLEYDQDRYAGFLLVARSSMNRTRLDSSVLNLDENDYREKMRLLGSGDFIIHALATHSDVFKEALDDPRYLRDHLLGLGALVSWAGTLSDIIKGRIEDKSFDRDEVKEHHMHAITIYLDHSCYHVGKLLCQHLDAIKAQKDKLLASAENSIGAEISQIQQQMENIDANAKERKNLDALFEVATAVANSVKIEEITLQNQSLRGRWLPILEAQQSLNAEIAKLGLDQLPDLADQKWLLKEDLLTVANSFEQIEKAQEYLQGLVDRNSVYEDVPAADLHKLQNTIEALPRTTEALPRPPVNSTTSDVSETQEGLEALRTMIYRLTGHGA